MVTANLHIERSSGRWTDSLRSYDVIVNGEKRAELLPGEQKSIEVNPGRVEVFLSLDWARSPVVSLDVEPGSEVRLRCRPGNPLTAFYRITLGRHKYMHLELMGADDG